MDGVVVSTSDIGHTTIFRQSDNNCRYFGFFYLDLIAREKVEV